MSPAPAEPGTALRLLPVLTALAFLVQVDARLMTPLLPTIARSLGTGVAGLGLAMTLYMLPYGLCQFVYGPLADRVGVIRVVRVAAIGFGIGTLLTSVAAHLTVLDAARFLTGAFAASVIPLTFAYIGDTVPYDERQATLGRFAAITSLAQSLSAAVGGVVTHFVSWRVLYLGVGVLSLVPALLLFRAPTAAVRRRAGAAGLGYALVLRRRAAWVLFGLVGFEGVFLWGGFTYLGAVAVARFGLNALEAGLLLACYGAATLAGGMAMPRIRERLPERHLAAVGGALKGGGYLLMLPPGPVGVYAVAIAMLGLGYIALHTTLQTRATELVPEARGTAIALFALFLFLGGALGAAVFGPLIDHGWHRLFLATCGLSLVVLGALAVGLLGAPPAAR